jgi:C-terminal processing protease CtpA/Prc
MKNILTLLTLLFAPFILRGQVKTNFDFEQIDTKNAPINWNLQGVSDNIAGGYVVRLDSQIVKNGKYTFLIEATNKAVESGFGSISYSIPAHYTGKRIVLRGYIKTENVSSDGFAGLWLRLDGNGGNVGFDNMQKQHINGTNDWKEYTVELPYSDKAQTIVLGVLLAGSKGKIWADDLRLTIDNTPIEKIIPRKKVLKGALSDSTFWQGSKMDIVTVSAQQVTDLTLLGRIWGFLKYHHPKVTSGDLQWDYELFPVMSKVLLSKNTNDRDKILLEWINSLGDISPCTTCDEPKGNFKITADHEWMNDPKISKELVEKLQYVYKNRNQAYSYYGLITPLGGGNFENEQAYPHLTKPDAGFRMLSLFRYWNMIHYFFPYRYLITEENWNDVLGASIPKFLAADNTLSYLKTVQELIVKIHDTHASSWSKDSIYRDWQGKLNAPVVVQFVENQLVVTKFAHKDLGEKSGLKIGDIIRKVNDTPIETLIEQWKPYTAGSNEVTQKSNIARKLLRGNDPKVKLDLERNGQKMDLMVERVTSASLNLSDWATMPEKGFSKIKDDVGYIYIGKIKTNQVDSAFQLFEDTRGIVIDIRNYPADFPIYEIGYYLSKDQKPFSRFSRTNNKNPGYFEFKDDILKMGGGRKPYSGKVAILINEAAVSSAEFHTMAFRKGTRAKVIGSQTAGADGNVSSFVLPGGVNTQITGIGCYYADFGETQRIGMVPDVEIRPTIAGIKAGKDEVLEKALEWIRSEKD